jgi:drug/metabolite transporter (DMT)-like permease
MTASHKHALLYLKLILTAVFWGGTFIAGRIVAREVGPFSAAFLRFLVASLILLALVLRTHRTLPMLDRRQIFPVTMLALTGVFAYNILFFSGLKTVTASRASLIITSNPAFIALFAAIFFGDRLTFSRTIGILLSISGAMIVISKGRPLQVLEGNLGLGELYICGCVLSWVLYSLIGKVALSRLSPMVSVTYSCVIGTLFLALPAFAEGLRASVTSCSYVAWISIIYLGLFGTTLGFIWYYEGIRTIGPSRAGVFINIVPICAVVMAFLILNEAIDASIALGAVFVFAGVYVTNRT